MSASSAIVDSVDRPYGALSTKFYFLVLLKLYNEIRTFLNIVLGFKLQKTLKKHIRAAIETSSKLQNSKDDIETKLNEVHLSNKAYSCF